MAELRRGSTPPLGDPALEAALVDLGRAIAYPAGSTDLVDAVGERLRGAGDGADAGRRDTRRMVRRALGRPVARPVRASLLLAAALVVLVVAVVAAAVLGLPGIRIVFGPVSTPMATGGSAASGSAPASAPGSVSAPGSPTAIAPSGPLGAALGLGQPVAVGSIDAAAGRHVPVPPGLGPATSAWLDPDAGVPIVSLVWRSSPTLPDAEATAFAGPSGIGAILTSIPATIDAPYLQKVVGEGGTVERVSVAGHAGYWIGGAPHELILLDRAGNAIPSTTRLVASSLIWEQDGQTMRLETALERDAAIAAASTAR